MKTREKNWCGEGDLNPHGLLTPRKLLIHRVSKSSKVATVLRFGHVNGHIKGVDAQNPSPWLQGKLAGD
jgi:hypothetical protein